MSKSMQAIQTCYKGYRFRSRLEARWAVFFDALGLRWEYEPEGFDLGDGVRYLPDFFVHFEGPGRPRCPRVGYWVEIKGQTPSADELRKLRALASASQHHAYLFEGPPGDQGIFSCSINESEGLGFGRDWWALWMTALVGCCPKRGMPDESKVKGAINAARAARFEFDETPA